MTIALHPAAVLCLWASAAVFFQPFKKSALWWTALSARRIAGFPNRRALQRLLRRIRVLPAASIVLFGLATPGTRVFLD